MRGGGGGVHLRRRRMLHAEAALLTQPGASNSLVTMGSQNCPSPAFNIGLFDCDSIDIALVKVCRMVMKSLST